MVMHPYIAKHIAESRIDDFRRAAGGAPSARREDDDDALHRPRARVLPLVVRLFPRRKRVIEQASEPCT
jgi:hypothetical protein